MRTLYIEPGSPWENGSMESFDGKLRDAMLNGDISHMRKASKALIERLRPHCDEVRPHSALGDRGVYMAGPTKPARQSLLTLATLGGPRERVLIDFYVG